MSRERFARVIDGRYRVLELLGEGGLGKVYLVEDLLKDKQRMALKVLSREGIGEEEIERLKDEFLAMARLRHPGIARAFDFGTEAETGRHYMTREYVDGVSLLEAAHQLPVEHLPDLFVQLCGALHYMHGRGVYHHDLKPQNVIVENCPPRTTRVRPRAKMLDFGLGTREKSPATLTGTVHYAPPEAFLGGPLDSRSDLYSLGVILYQVLTGRLPFDEGKPIAVINSHLRRQPEPPRAVEPKISRGMESIILRLLEKDPAHRFSSAQEVKEAILQTAARPGALAPVRIIEESLAAGTFVGRDRPLEALFSALGALKERRPSRPAAVLVCGPAGIGKSRLIDEFRQQAQMEEIPFYSGHCLASGSAPGGPFLRILRHIRSRLETASDAEAGDAGDPGLLLEQLEQTGRGDTDAETAPRRSAATAPARIRSALVNFLARHGRLAPMVVHLEDLHRADDLSMEAFERLLRRALDNGILLTATLREDDAPEAIQERLGRFRQDPRLLVVELPALNQEEVLQLLRSILGTSQDFRRLAGLVSRRSGGNPLFIEELMKSLHEDGSLRMVSGRWRFDLDRLGEHLPASVGEMISRRLERLGHAERELLGTLAALDRPVGPGLLGAVRGAPRKTIQSDLDSLIHKGLVRIEVSRGRSPRFEIRHRPVLDVVYSGLGKHARALHRRIGEVLEAARGRGSGEALEELAWHFVQAGDRDRGLRYSLEAGERADAMHANDRAAGHYEAVLRLLGRKNRSLRAEILFRCGEVRKRIGDQAAAIRHFKKAQEVWADLGDPELQVKALEQIAWCHGAAGQYDRALKIAKQALAIAEGRDNREGTAKSLNTIGMILSRSGSGRSALDYYRRALSLWEEVGDPLRIAGTLNNMGLVCLFEGKPEESLGYLQRSLELRRTAGDRRLTAQSLNNIGLSLQGMGRHEEALRSFKECVDLAGRVESKTDQASCLFNQAETEVMLGRYDTSLHTFEAAIALMEEMHNRHHLPTCLDGMARAYLHLGEVASAAATHARALEEARRLHDPVQEGFALAGLAYDRFRLGEDAEAKTLVKDAEELAEKLDHQRLRARVLESRYRIARARETRKTLEATAKSLEAIAGESGLDPDRLLGMQARADALLAAGRWQEAEGVLAEAQGIAHRLARTETEWEILERLGRCATEQGDPAAAAKRFGAAAELIRGIAANIADQSMRERYLRCEERRRVLDRGVGEAAAPVAAGAAEAATVLSSRALLALHDITRAITSILSIDELLERVMDLAIDLIGAERGILFLRDETTDEMRIRVARNTEKETLKDATEYSSQVLKETEEGRSILAIDAGSDDRFRNFQSVSLFHIRSLMCVPLRYQDRTLGTVYLDTRHARKAFSEDDLRFLEIFAGQAAIAIENARLYSRLQQENEYLRQSLEERYRYGHIIGRSGGMQQVFGLLDRLKDTALPVLIHGESGTGKELVARALHHNSPRRDAHFVTENCAALPETLLESELFGHVKGAFTGADRPKEGLFLVADGGTLFLDEIADMSPSMQSKLLRAIQEGEIRPVGSNTVRKVDVRVLSATNQPPQKLIADGKLRQDLYYRLSVVTIDLPPLRERKEDIPLLVQHFLDRIAETNQRPPYQVTQEAMDLLLRYHWPGNVRELENTLSRLALFADDKITQKIIELDRQTYEKLTGLEIPPSEIPTLEEVEKRHILRVLDEVGGDRTLAAQRLGISRATIFRKLKQYRME